MNYQRDLLQENPDLTWVASGSTKLRTWETGTGSTWGGSRKGLEWEWFKLLLQRAIHECHHSMPDRLKGGSLKGGLALLLSQEGHLPKDRPLPSWTRGRGPRNWKRKVSTKSLLWAQSKYLIISNQNFKSLRS